MDEREKWLREEDTPEISPEEKAAQERVKAIFKSIGVEEEKPEEVIVPEHAESIEAEEIPEISVPETSVPETEEVQEEAQEETECKDAEDKEDVAEDTETPEQEEAKPNHGEIKLKTVRTLTKEEKQAIAKKKIAAKKKKNKKLMKKIIWVLVVILLVVIGGGLVADYLPGHQTGEIVVVIPENSTTADIAKILKKDNLILSENFFRVMSKIRGVDSKYNFGKFKVNRGAGYEELFTTLTQAGTNVDAVKVTIPEGYEIYKIADLLEEKGLIDKEKFYYLVDYGEFDYDFIEDIPVRENRLEGYLFPNTYTFVPNDEKAIINEMLMQFEKVYAKYEDRAEEMGMTMDEVITLASVIEREAQGDEDRKLVSSVFHNRLESTKYPYLQSCATVQYILKERKPVLSVEDTKIDSPYNTYINEGLPIGPIASPGEKSIEAALYPEESDYLFFVMGSDGKHHFSETYEEHKQNKNN